MGFNKTLKLTNSAIQLKSLSPDRKKKKKSVHINSDLNKVKKNFTEKKIRKTVLFLLKKKSEKQCKSQHLIIYLRP